MTLDFDPANVGRCAIAIMAKAPQAGRCKTRLCPPLLPEEAAALSGAFLWDMTATMALAGLVAPIDGFVAFAPAGSEALLRTWLAPGMRLLVADGVGVEEAGVAGFGRPLLQTVRALLAAGYDSACVLNSDSPTLPAGVLVEAAAVLAEGEAGAVLGPASDGGYYLLGLRSAAAVMFADIAWSTADVAAQTRRQARLAGLSMVELAGWYDVDDQDSLLRLLRDVERDGGDGVAATASALNRLGLRERMGMPA
jgi:rSAM/selenodomain-associated transferase 1